MRSGIQYELGDIVIIPFPFTDLTTIKQRPVLIISSTDYNQMTEDVIVCGITSNINETKHSVVIDNTALIEGELPIISRIKVDKLFTLKQQLIKKRIAKVKPAVLKKVKEELDQLITF